MVHELGNPCGGSPDIVMSVAAWRRNGVGEATAGTSVLVALHHPTSDPSHTTFHFVSSSYGFTSSPPPALSLSRPLKRQLCHPSAEGSSKPLILRVTDGVPSDVVSLDVKTSHS